MPETTQSPHKNGRLVSKTCAADAAEFFSYGQNHSSDNQCFRFHTLLLMPAYYGDTDTR